MGHSNTDIMLTYADWGGLQRVNKNIWFYTCFHSYTSLWSLILVPKLIIKVLENLVLILPYTHPNTLYRGHPILTSPKGGGGKSHLKYADVSFAPPWTKMEIYPVERSDCVPIIVIPVVGLRG